MPWEEWQLCGFQSCIPCPSIRSSQKRVQLTVSSLDFMVAIWGLKAVWGGVCLKTTESLCGLCINNWRVLHFPSAVSDDFPNKGSPPSALDNPLYGSAQVKFRETCLTSLPQSLFTSRCLSVLAKYFIMVFRFTITDWWIPLITIYFNSGNQVIAVLVGVAGYLVPLWTPKLWTEKHCFLFGVVEPYHIPLIQELSVYCKQVTMVWCCRKL